jgi:hypothetical protein
MMKTSEEEKKNGDDITEIIDAGQLSPNPRTATSVTSNSNIHPFAPRTTSPESNFEGSALEALLSAQLSAGDTVKTRNISPKPRHQRGVSWDLGIPETLPGQSVSQPSNPKIAMPLTLNRGVSVPAAAIGKPPIRVGKTNRYNMTSIKPSIGIRKSSNSGGSHGSSRSPVPVRNRYGALDKPSNLALEAESYLNEINKNEVNAETNLMRQLDEKDPLRPRAGTEASILSEVPINEIEHSFIIEDQDGLVLPASESEKDGSSTRNKQTMKKPLDNGSHKRHMTVEQALFGLTSALTEMKANDQLERQHHGHQDSIGTHGSKDLFDVAGALFDRAHKTNVTSKEPVEDKHEPARPRLNSQESKSKRNVVAGSRWAVIKNNLGDIKKAEEENPDDILPENRDVEEGVKEGSDGSDMDYSGDSTEENSVDHIAHDTKKSRFTRIKSKNVNPFKHLPYASKSISADKAFYR